jgi:dienelactone hydrolase
MRLLLVSVVLLAVTSAAHAEIKNKVVSYQHDGKTFKCYLAWDDAQSGKRPGVLVFPEWWGLNEYAKKRADQLAALGCVALAVDLYGDGKVTDNPKESGAWAGALRKDIQDWLGRSLEAIKLLKSDDKVDPDRMAAMGYCFGGSTSLMLAHHAAPLKAVVSFHGALLEPTDEQAKSIKTKILICHGADDSFIPEELIGKVKAAYDRNKVDYRFVAYPGAQHSFTVQGADARGLKGIRYNEAADRQSWEDMRKLFTQAIGAK